MIVSAASRTEPIAKPTSRRDPELRQLYLAAALPAIPRLLGSIDRNPFRATYGCLDRQFWHYRTSSFPSEMYQEGVLPLALVHGYEFPENRWHGDARVRELAIAALRFSARNGHADGSCDDYYPFERALGAAVFSLQAAAQACQLLELDDAEILAGLVKRARWVALHNETGRLANHHALAVLGLTRLGQLTGQAEFRQAAEQRLNQLLSWQSSEGWFEEYGGADPGYQTVSIDCLAKYRLLTGDTRVDEPLRRAVEFARWFLHPDGSYGGEYGSRGTYHFYPHGFELLAYENSAAADLADGFLRGMAANRQADFQDDRLYVHRLGNLLEAWHDWAPVRPSLVDNQPAEGPPDRPTATHHFVAAGLLVHRTPAVHTVVSAARGGVFKHFSASEPPITDAGLILETSAGLIAVSQLHIDSHTVRVSTLGDGWQLSVAGLLHQVRFVTATPVKQALFHLGQWCVGRWCRSLVRSLLQRRLITARNAVPIQLTRTFQFEPARDAPHCLRVTDRIELRDARIQVRRMSFASDLQATYVAATGVYQEAVRQPWTSLDQHVAELNARRSVVIRRTIV